MGLKKVTYKCDYCYGKLFEMGKVYNCLDGGKVLLYKIFQCIDCGQEFRWLWEEERLPIIIELEETK